MAARALIAVKLVSLLVASMLATPAYSQVGSALTLTIEGPQSLTYGDDPPLVSGRLSLAVVGLPNRPVEIRSGATTVAATTTDFTGSYTAAVPVSNAGTYTLTAVGDPGTPLESRSAPLTVTVHPRPIEVSADPGQSKTAGDPDPLLTYSVTAGSLLEPDLFTGELSREPGESSGPYPITRGTLTIEDGNGGANYDLSFLGGLFQIWPLPAVSISAGWTHSCAALANGGVRCWGENGRGRLGDGTTVDRSTPVSVVDLTDVVAVTAGGYHTCALIVDGSARCWGDNTRGQLGNGESGTFSTVPVQVSGLTNIIEISAGGEHTCARLANLSVRCWGANHRGQVGDGSGTNRSLPVNVFVGQTLAVSAGAFHSCAVRTNGAVRCWGDGSDGQLGSGSWATQLSSVPVSGITDAVGISAGFGHTCATRAGGAASCWGSNLVGELGDGTLDWSNTPVDVVGLEGIESMHAHYHYTCASLADGSARCWGLNWEGQLGSGSEELDSIEPVEVSGLQGHLALDTGGMHACAILADGSAHCWGWNWNGQIGDGTDESRRTPTPVAPWD